MADDQISIKIGADASEVKPATDAASASIGTVSNAATDTRGAVTALGGAMRDYSAGAEAAARASSSDLAPALQRSAVSAVQARAGMTNLASQISGVATAVSGGANPLVAFAEHASQMGTAITQLTGKVGGFAGFIGGPWGIAITGAIAVLGTLWSRHQDAAAAEAQHTNAADRLKAAIDRLNGASEANNHTTEAGIRMDIAAANISRLRERKIRDGLQADLDAAKARLKAMQDQMTSGQGGSATPGLAVAAIVAGRQIADLGAQIAAQNKKVAEAAFTVRSGIAQIGLLEAADDADTTTAATRRLDDALGALINRFTAAGSKMTLADFRAQAAQLDKAKAALRRPAPAAPRAVESARTDIERRESAVRLAITKTETDASLAAQAKELEAAQGNAAQQLVIANRIAEYTKAKYGEESQQYRDAQAKIVQIRKDAEAELRQLTEQHAKANDQRLLDGIAAEESAAKFRVTMTRETNAQLLVEQRGFEDRRFAIELAALKRAQSLINRDTDKVKYAQGNAQIEQLERQHQQRLTQIDQQAQLQRTQVARQAIKAVSQSWGDAIAKMVTFQQGFQATVKQMWQGLRQAIGQAIAQILQQYIEQLLISAIFGKANATGQIGAAAAVAGANAYAATAAIPMIGPELAPAAAWSAYAGALAFQGLAVPGLDVGAWNLSKDQLAVVHSGEMVIPAQIAGPLRTSLTQAAVNGNAPLAANDGSRGGDLHYHDHTGTLTPGQIVANRGAVAKALVMAHREGAFAGTRISF